MAKHPKHGDKDDGDKGYDFDDPQPEVVEAPALVLDRKSVV